MTADLSELLAGTGMQRIEAHSLLQLGLGSPEIAPRDQRRRLVQQLCHLLQRRCPRQPGLRIGILRAQCQRTGETRVRQRGIAFLKRGITSRQCIAEHCRH